MAHPGHGVPAPAAEAPVATEESAAPRSARVASWGLIGLAVLSPWAMGAVTPAGVRTISVLSLALALGVALHQAWRGAVFFPRVPLWPLVVLILLAFLQIAPWPST